MDQRATGYKNTAPKWQFALISKTIVTHVLKATLIFIPSKPRSIEFVKVEVPLWKIS